MFKVTERGIEKFGEPIELSEEDKEFIREMFWEFSEYEREEVYSVP